MDIDQKSIKILKSNYWKNGWRDTSKRVLSESDADYLYNRGLQLGSVKISHDNLVKEVVNMSRNIDMANCVTLFSRSLPTRTLQDRSFLSSAVQAVKFREHSHTSNGACQTCGLYENEAIDQDVLIFEKVMWGGVRLTSIEYVWLDLKLMSHDVKPEKNCEDFLKLISEFESKGEKLSASKFAASLKELEGNKAERDVLCGILGICDVLQHPDHPGFLDQYRAVKDRELPNQHYIDLEWPFCWYNSSFGVNKAAVEHFVKLLS